MDAGFDGLVDGGGWCCGLIDGGVKTCFPRRAVCYATSDCCEGLTLHRPPCGLRPSDAGYGFCE